MKSQHTPRPWYAHKNEFYSDVKIGPESYSQTLASCQENPYISPKVTMDVAFANATLMSVSPEMLEALQNVVKSDQFKDMHYDLQNEIIYCINKGLGIEL
jgi:hypothetical protein